MAFLRILFRMSPAQPISKPRYPRIGLLTYHRSVNDGSIMQAYCLYQLLSREFPDALVEIIDYIPASLHRRHMRLALYNFRPPFFNPRYVWTYFNQTAFLRRACRLSSKRLISDDLAKTQRFIAALEYDAIVVGSDNAWELDRIPQPPNAYYRPSLTVPTFAFAVSADPVVGTRMIPSQGLAALRSALEAFRVITVRDQATHALLESMGIAAERIGYLPDPTLLWDFRRHLGKRVLSKPGVRPRAGLAVSPRVARLLQPHLMAAGFDVVSLMGSRQLKGAISPPSFSRIEDRLALYASLDAMFSDRFHMSIFALKHGCGPVVFLEDSARWQQPNSKGRDLLTRLGLGEMVWRIDDDNVSANAVQTLLATWPRVSPGLAQRIDALRLEAEATSLSGLSTALQDISRGQTRDLTH